MVTRSDLPPAERSTTCPSCPEVGFGAIERYWSSVFNTMAIYIHDIVDADLVQRLDSDTLQWGTWQVQQFRLKSKLGRYYEWKHVDLGTTDIAEARTKICETYAKIKEQTDE